LISEQDFLLYPALSEKYEPAFDPSSSELPGSGSPSETCGEGIALFCNCCKKSFYVRRSCLLRACPHCYEKWAAIEGKAAAWRFWTGIKYIYQGYRGIRYLHYVISMRPGGKSFDELRTDARKISRAHGIVGGLLVPHTHRLDDEGSRETDGTIHFHGIGIAPGNVEPGGTDGDTIFKIIPDPKKDQSKPSKYRGFLYFSEVKNCVQYLLSHAAIIEGKHALTWWGLLSYNQLNTGTLKEFCPDGFDFINSPMKSKCPFCHSTDTEPCYQLDLVPRLSKSRQWEQGSDWMLIEAHPPPDEKPPDPYLGPIDRRESSFITLDSYFDLC